MLPSSYSSHRARVAFLLRETAHGDAEGSLPPTATMTKMGCCNQPLACCWNGGCVATPRDATTGVLLERASTNAGTAVAGAGIDDCYYRCHHLLELASTIATTVVTICWNWRRRLLRTSVVTNCWNWHRRLLQPATRFAGTGRALTADEFFLLEPALILLEPAKFLLQSTNGVFVAELTVEKAATCVGPCYDRR